MNKEISEYSKISSNLGIQERLHLFTGYTCNNQCKFCMDNNGPGLREMIRKITPDDVRNELLRFRESGLVLFTANEPTTNPNLLTYIKTAADMNYRLIGLISNGRRLKDKDFCRAILEAGVNDLTIAIQGASPEVHDALTSRPGSYQETMLGIRNMSELKEEFDFNFFLNTVVNKMNIHQIEDIIRQNISFKFDQLIFNAVRIIGAAVNFAEELYVPLTEVVRVLRYALEKFGGAIEPGKISLKFVPYCLCSGLESIIGFHESVTSKLDYSPDSEPVSGNQYADFIKREDCSRCVYDSICYGVDKENVKRSGWDGFVPVEVLPGHRPEPEPDPEPVPGEKIFKDHVKKIEEQMNLSGKTGHFTPKEIEEKKKEMQILVEKIRPGKASNIKEQVDTVFRIGNICLDLDDLKSAAHYFKLAINIEPRFAAAYIRLSEVFFRMGQNEMAQKAVELAKKTPYLCEEDDIRILILEKAIAC